MPSGAPPGRRAAPRASAGFPLGRLSVAPPTDTATAGKRQRVRRGNVSCRNTGLNANPRLTGDQAVAVITAADAEAIRLARRAEHLLFLNSVLAQAGRPVDVTFNTILQQELGLDLTVAADREVANRQAERFRRIADTLESGILSYTCRSPGCNGEFAFTFPGNNTMRLCQAFWTLAEPPLTLAQTQAVTVMHETAHIHFDMDHANRTRRANADCLESFALRLAGLRAPHSCAVQVPPP